MRDEDDADGAVVGRPRCLEVLLAEGHDLLFEPIGVSMLLLGCWERHTIPERRSCSAPAHPWSHIWVNDGGDLVVGEVAGDGVFEVLGKVAKRVVVALI